MTEYTIEGEHIKTIDDIVIPQNVVKLTIKNTCIHKLLLPYLPKLTYLEITRNHNLTSVDLTNNIGLEILDISYNNLTSVNLTNNTKLVTLYLSGNKLTSVDLTNNVALVNLNLSCNKLTSIDLNNNTTLVALNLSDNNLTSIDLTNNTTIEKLYISRNKLYNPSRLSPIINLQELYTRKTNVKSISTYLYCSYKLTILCSDIWKINNYIV